MGSDDQPVHLGTLEASGVQMTDGGWKLVIETDQGTFLLTADDKMAVDALSANTDNFVRHVVSGEAAGE